MGLPTFAIANNDVTAALYDPHDRCRMPSTDHAKPAIGYVPSKRQLGNKRIGSRQLVKK
jgi:hypothetical protein